MTSLPGKMKMTFAELFERRLKLISGTKTRIKITVHAEIRYSYGITSELESKYYGPFQVSISKLTKRDMYKLMMYVLLTNGFTILSTQTIEEIGASIITHKKSFFKHHKMGRLKLESFFLDNKNKFRVQGSDTSFIDYLWHEVKGKRGFKTYTYEKLSEELVEYADMYPFMSIQEIIDWIKNCHSNISLHAYSCSYKKFISHILNTPDIVLTFFVKDHHLHPITDPELKRAASSCNQNGSINLFQHMSELKWSRRHDKFVQYDDLSNQTEIHVIVCPPEMQFKQAVCEYMQKSGYYVEYLHLKSQISNLKSLF